MNSRNFLKITQDESSRTNILGVLIQISEADTIKVNEDIYDLSPERYRAIFFTGYTGKTMENENDILLNNNIINDLVYTGNGDRDTKRKEFFTITLLKVVDDLQNKTFDEITDDSDSLQGEGVEIIIPSNIIDIYTRLEILLGLKISGHSGTPSEASKLRDELYKRGENQYGQQYRNAPDKFST